MSSEEIPVVQPLQPVHQEDHHHALQPLVAHPMSAGPIDSLTCQWVGCGERCTSAETLYDHVCERHIGRKSTNNLNLTCHWGACRTTTVKRDHITSHMRVHVPLKPHKCDFCGKSFKRPQDLKKHVKTHADESVLEANMNQQASGNNVFHQQDTKGGNAYFQGGHDMGSGAYPPAPGQTVGSNNGFYPNPQQYSGYGQVNYPGSNLGDQQSMDTRRRAIEALNDFLGDVKRRALDPSTYYDVGQRLNTQSLPLPVSSGAGYSLSSGYGGQQGGNNFSATNSLMESFGGSGGGGVSMNGGGAHGPLTQSYSLPMSNARTKTDLLDIDRFLEQLQSTIYESSHNAAAAGISQPNAHAQMPAGYPGFNNNYQRNGQSPPQQFHHGSTSSSSGVQPLTSVAQLASMSANAQALDTPALTPASVSSYASSGQSPMSSHSRSSTDATSMYPQLPSVTGISDMGPSYTSAPPSGLASGFDGFEGRRYSGGRLQREAPPRESDDMELDTEQASTPRKAERPGSSSNVDPALRGDAPSNSPEQSSGAVSDSTEDRNQEAWVENVRVIESIRNWVRDRLAAGEFERDQDSTPEPNHQQSDVDVKHESTTDPQLEQQLVDSVAEDNKLDEEQIAYPTLKSEEP